MSETFGTWILQQFDSISQSIEWTISLIPTERHYAVPPYPLGEWPLARHLFHINCADQYGTIPSIKQWFDGVRPSIWNEQLEDARWDPKLTVEELVSTYHQLGNEAITLIQQVNNDQWDEFRKTGWGEVTLKWVVAKRYQHLVEHCHNLLQLALFWDRAESMAKLLRQP